MLGLIVQRHNALPGLSGPTLAGKGEVAPKAVLQWKQTILGLLVKGNPVPHLFFTILDAVAVYYRRRGSESDRTTRTRPWH